MSAIKLGMRRRHPFCDCLPACQTYVCEWPEHVGNPNVPWCFGAHDDIERECGAICDDCAAGVIGERRRAPEVLSI